MGETTNLSLFVHSKKIDTFRGANLVKKSGKIYVQTTKKILPFFQTSRILDHTIKDEFQFRKLSATHPTRIRRNGARLHCKSLAPFACTQREISKSRNVILQIGD